MLGFAFEFDYGSHGVTSRKVLGLSVSVAREQKQQVDSSSSYSELNQTHHWSLFSADVLGVIRGKYWSVLRAVKIGESVVDRQLGIQGIKRYTFRCGR